jgi:hypothetical protein
MEQIAELLKSMVAMKETAKYMTDQTANKDLLPVVGSGNGRLDMAGTAVDKTRKADKMIDRCGIYLVGTRSMELGYPSTAIAEPSLDRWESEENQRGTPGADWEAMTGRSEPKTEKVIAKAGLVVMSDNPDNEDQDLDLST